MIKDAAAKHLLLVEAESRRDRYKSHFVQSLLLDDAEKHLKEAIAPPVEMTPVNPDPVVQKPKSAPSMEIDYLSKRKNKDKRLIKNRVGSIEERLQKAANKLDLCGEVKIADKIDLLLKKLEEDK